MPVIVLSVPPIAIKKKKKKKVTRLKLGARMTQ